MELARNLSLSAQRAESKTSIQYWSQGIILVNWPWQLQEHDELQKVTEMVHEQGACNVVVDLSSVDVVGCTTFTRLLELRQLLQDRGHTPMPALTLDEQTAIGWIDQM